jgi:hypothetical protein
VRTPPLRAVEDFEALHLAVTELGVSDRPRVMIGYMQFYRVLAAVVEAARGLELDAPLLVEFGRPLGVPLPRSLLGSDVIMMDRIGPELEFWKRRAVRGVFASRPRIVREPVEHGDNTLRLELHSYSHVRNPLPDLAAVCAPPPAWQAIDLSAVVAQHSAELPIHAASSTHA